MRFSLFFLCVLALALPVCAEDPQPRKIVLIAGKKSHGPGAHDYERTMRLFKVMLDNSNVADRVRVEVHEKGWPEDEKTFDDADTIVFYSDGRDGDKYSDAPFVVGNRMQVLEKQMRRGCGMMTMHFSTFVTDEQGERVLDWVGGYFDWEGEKGKRDWYSKISQVETIELAERDHPISRGVPRMVQLRDEVYWKLRFRPDDKRLTPIWRALDVKDPEPNPHVSTVGWAIERSDGGRGFGTSVGHGYRLWQDDGIRKLFLNAIAWTAKAEIPADGVEAKFYSDDQVNVALAGVKGSQPAAVEPPMHVLLLSGNKAHGWHNGAKSTPAVKAALEADWRITVNVIEDFEELAKVDLSSYSTVVLNNYCNWHDSKPPSDGAKAAFLKYLKAGGGLVVVHFANGAFHYSLPEAGASDWPEYRKIVRRVWDHHGKGESQSGHDAFGNFTVNVAGEHPIVSGLKSFEVTDELYFRQAGSEPIEPLLSARSQVTKRDEPLAWAYEYGQARVFQTLLGHSEQTYDAYEAREMLRRAVAWTSQRKIAPLPKDKEKLAAPAKEPVPVAAGKFGQALNAKQSGIVLAGKPEDTSPPLTVECWVKLDTKRGFNILVASEPKASSTHWELYSYAGSGVCSVYLPGRGGEFKSDANICDGNWHHVGFSLDKRVKIYVDGKLALDREVKQLDQNPSSGGIGVGRLVEGTIGCDGLIDDVRIRRGAFPLDRVLEKAVAVDDSTSVLLSFDSAAELAKLQVKTAAVVKPASDLPKADHWGKEAVGFKWKEEDSRDDRWKDAEIGRFLASSLPLGSQAGTVAKGLSIRLGDKQEATVCYDTANMKLRAAWTGGFLKFTTARYGLIMPPLIDGEPLFLAKESPGWEGKEIQYRGMKVYGDRIVLRYEVDGVGIEESPWAENAGEKLVITRAVQVAATSNKLVMRLGEPLAKNDQVEIKRSPGGHVAVVRGEAGGVVYQFRGPVGGEWNVEGDQLRLALPPSDKERSFEVCMWSGSEDDIESFAPQIVSATRSFRLDFQDWKPSARWTEPIVTQGKLAADDGPLVVDTLTIPFDNPYKALFFTSGHDILDKDRIAVGTVHGDVWIVSGVSGDLKELRWKRFATGLFQPLGLVAKKDGIYVLGRDQITRLRDINRDGEADEYECFTNKMPTSPGGHDYTTCLETDADGNFYFITAQQGIWRLSPDGKQLENIAGGLRNPNGLGVGYAPGEDQPIITAAPQEGNWTPASYIAEARPGDWFGFGGPKITPERPLGWTQPLCFIPRRRDNSSGGQVWVPSDRWGPLEGQLLHFSYGQCRMMLVLREVIKGQPQGGTVEMTPLFESGAMRGRFSPADGHLYVTGLRGWTTAATQDGCLQRVRYTGRPVHLPVKWKTMQNGISLTFSDPLSRSSAEDVGNYHLEQWNYRYAESYGSPDFKVSDPKQEGHDTVRVESATLLDDDKTVFLEIKDVKPVNQLTVGYALTAADGAELRNTIAYTIHNVGPDHMDPAQLNRHSAPGRLTADEESKLRPGLVAELVQGDARQLSIPRLAVLHFNAPPKGDRLGQPLKYTLRGYLYVPLKGDYAIAAQGRGTVRIFVNDNQVFEATGDLTPAVPGRVSLNSGYNALRVEYESTYFLIDTALRLMWAGDDGRLAPIPPTALFHRGDEPELLKAMQIERGRRLFADRHCAKCHHLPGDGWAKGIRQPPSLVDAGKRLSKEWIAQWLLDPRSMRNHATMPRQFNAAKPEDRQIAANLAAHVAGDSNPATRPARPATEDELEQGRDLYENLGCIACHKLTPPKEDDEFNRTSLHYVNAKFSPAALKAHLLSPHRHHPTSRMPDFQISEGEASLLVGYLAAAAEGKVEALPELAKADAALGAKQFVEFRCVNCHAEKETTSGSIVHSLFRRPTEGCLSADPTLRRDAPAMHFTREERAAMIAYLKDQPKQYFVHVPARQSQALFEELRCAACHKRDHDQATRIAVLTEESEKGLTPELLPDLTWAGEKLHRRWTEKQIAGQLDYRARPWLKARMPAFPAYAEALSLGLEAEHGVPDTAPLRSSPKRESKENLVEIGRQLTLKENLDCRQCHAIGDLEPMGDEKTKLAPGINFAHIRERLTHDYYLRFTLDPPRWDVSNRMPKLAADGRTTKVTTFYDGDAEKQFEAIWHYLQTVEKPSKP